MTANLYQQWVAFYKVHYPEMAPHERDSYARLHSAEGWDPYQGRA